MIIEIKGYKNTELKFDRISNGIKVYSGHTTKNRGTKRVTIFLHEQNGNSRVRSIQGLTQTNITEYEIK